jgi:hypothetical protein
MWVQTSYNNARALQNSINCSLQNIRSYLLCSYWHTQHNYERPIKISQCLIPIILICLKRLQYKMRISRKSCRINCCAMWCTKLTAVETEICTKTNAGSIKSQHVYRASYVSNFINLSCCQYLYLNQEATRVSSTEGEKIMWKDFPGKYFQIS